MEHNITLVISALFLFSYSGPSGILGSDRKHNTAKACARGVRIVALSISSHEQTQ